MPSEALLCMIQCRVQGKLISSRSSAVALGSGQCLKPLCGRAMIKWDRSHELPLVSLYLRSETNNNILNEVFQDPGQEYLCFGTILVTLRQLTHLLNELAMLLKSQKITAAHSTLCLALMTQKQILHSVLQNCSSALEYKSLYLKGTFSPQI